MKQLCQNHAQPTRSKLVSFKYTFFFLMNSLALKYYCSLENKKKPHQHTGTEIYNVACFGHIKAKLTVKILAN